MNEGRASHQTVGANQQTVGAKTGLLHCYPSGIFPHKRIENLTNTTYIESATAASSRALPSHLTQVANTQHTTHTQKLHPGIPLVLQASAVPMDASGSLTSQRRTCTRGLLSAYRLNCHSSNHQGYSTAFSFMYNTAQTQRPFRCSAVVELRASASPASPRTLRSNNTIL